MTYGTVQPGWIERAFSALGFVKARSVSPGELYRSPTPTFAPLSWPGWEHYEHQHGASQDEQRAKLAATSSWVYACVSAIANEASVARLVVKRRTGDDGEEDEENHDLERLWEAPNPFMGRSFLVSFWLWQRLLLGKAYLYWVPDASGQIAEVWPVPALTLTPIRDPKRFISGYWFKARADAQPIRIDARYITYSRIPHPFDVYDGLSPLAAAWIDIEGELAMAKWNRAFFAQENATPEGLITVNKDMLDSDIARVRQEISEFFGGGKRRVAVARAGDMDWKAFGRSQKDMEFLQGRTYSGEAIMRVFGIPAGYFAKDATRANSEGAKATMIENAVWPHLVALAEDLNAQTLPAHWSDPDLRVAFDDIRPRNIQLELQQFEAWKAVLTVNELRKLADFDDLPPEDARGPLFVKEIEMGAAAPEEPMADPESMPPAELPEDDAETPPDGPGDAEADDPQSDPAPPEIAAQEPAQKVADLRRWQTKALKALKEGKRPAVRFESAVIPAAAHAAIKAALAEAQTADAVRAAFKAADAEARAEALVDDVWAGALDWARKAMEDA